MPVGFNSPARNLFLLGSSGAQVVSNFFESISKASTTDGVFIPDEIRYIESNKKYALAGSAQDSNSKGFGWFERQDYDLVTGSLTTDYSVRIESPQAGVTTTLRAMELDSNDNLIVVGFSGTGPWIAKYSKDGVLDWQSTTNSANVRYLGITSDSSGNYYACGRTSYALSDTQAFVEKFDSNGNPGWGKQAFMLGRDVVLTKISANDRGEVVAVGFLEDDSADKGYIVKIDTTTGEVLWDRTLERNISGFGLGNPSTGSTDSITPAHVKCTACYIDSQDQIYVVGTIDGNSPNDNGVGEFLIKYTAEGNMVWQRERDTRDYTASDGAPNSVPFDVKSDGETEQTVVLSVEDGGAFALNDSDIFISKYSKNGDLVFRRRISKGGDNLGAACLDADPSFYYIMFRDQQLDGLAGEPDRYTFGKVSTSGNGFGNFQYDDGEDIIDYTIVSNAENKIGRLSDGSVTNSASDLMTYPFTANKLVFDDLATHVSNKKRQMDAADSFEYSGSPAIRVADFQELNLLGDVYSGSGDWLDQSGKGNNGLPSLTEPFFGAGGVSFDGSGDSLSVGPLLPTSTGTAFTVDMYWYSTSNTSQKCLWEQHGGGSGRTAYFVDGTNAFLVSEGNVIGNFAYSDNVWYFTRVTYTAGGAIEVFVDGVSRGTGTQTVGVDNVNFVIGDRSGASESFNGYISNCRVVVGSALNGTEVPTEPLTRVPGTELLTCQGDTIADASANNFTITANGNAAPTDDGPTHNAAGYWEFDGTDKKFSVPYNDAWTLPGDFTLEAWIYRNSAFDASWWRDAIMGHDDGGGNNNKWIFSHSGTSLFFHTNTTAGSAQYIQAPTGWVPTNSEWYNVVVTRSGNTYTFYQNSTSLGSVTNSSAIPAASASLTIGNAEGGGLFDGRFGEVRIYPRALTAAAVFQNYNATRYKYDGIAPNTSPRIGPGIVYDGLVLNYDFGNEFCIERLGTIQG